MFNFCLKQNENPFLKLNLIKIYVIYLFFSGDVSLRKGFECKKCSRRFSWKSTLNYHMKRECGKTFLCEKCNKQFRSFYGSQMHLRNGCEAVFQCVKCSKKYFSSYALKRHVEDCTK